LTDPLLGGSMNIDDKNLNLNDPTILREYFRLFSTELKRLSDQIDLQNSKFETWKNDIDAKLDKIKNDLIAPFRIETSKEIAKLNAKWGFVGGTIPVALIVLIEFLKSK